MGIQKHRDLAVATNIVCGQRVEITTELGDRDRGSDGDGHANPRAGVARAVDELHGALNSTTYCWLKYVHGLSVRI